MYSRLDPSKNHGKEGTGIGLAISKYFIDAMKGTVNAESIYGEGSSPKKAVVYFPGGGSRRWQMPSNGSIKNT